MGLRFYLSNDEVALSAATAKTVLQLRAPANQRVKVNGLGLYFDGTTATAEPVRVRILRQTSAGTMSSATPVKADDSLAESIQATGGANASAEPTAGDVLKILNIHPQRGYEWTAPLGRELFVGAGDRLGIECTAPAAVNVIPWLDCEE